VIAKLTGVVDSLGDGYAVLDVRGVGYLVLCSARTHSRLVAGQAATLLIETHVREDAIHLYGFAEPAERDWFRLLITVQGVGGKAALAILSAVPAETLVGAIAAGDRAAITRAPGIGIKLATRVVAELKDKATAASHVSVISRRSAAIAAPAAEAVSALVNLGFKPAEAMEAVGGVAEKLGADASVEALIASSLAGLAPKVHGP
jgi:Holliday junction DNA helicase RuvA